MGNTLTIVGLGAGDLNQLPYGVYKILKNAGNVYIRTKEHPVVAELQEEGVDFHSFDSLYEMEVNFENVYRGIVDKLWEAAKEKDIVYAVPGHPLVAEHTVQLLLQEEPLTKVNIQLQGGQSFLDATFQSLKVDPIYGFQLLDGPVLMAEQPNIQQHVLIAQVYDSLIASHVKLVLMERYPDSYPVTVVTAAGSSRESIVTVPLYELDRCIQVNNLTAVYLSPIQENHLLTREFSHLRGVIRTLRGPEGCPWDMKQTHKSLRPYLLEEAYEVMEAVDEQDDAHLAEELGDVLLQVLLHAQIGEDEGFFTIEDVIQLLTEKMIRRHPHVFGDKKHLNPDDVKETWDELKKEERADKNQPPTLSQLDGIPAHLPGLSKAEKLQKKAAKVGFDWGEVRPIFNKIEEELNEFKDAAKLQDQDNMEAELGDCLFALVNLSRYYRIDPEVALSRTNRKFYQRFRYIELALKTLNQSVEDTPLDKLEELWQQAKKVSKKKDY